MIARGCRSLALGAALVLSGCSAPGATGQPVAITIRNQATVPVRVLVGRFIPGTASVTPSDAQADVLVAPGGETIVSLVPGRYSLEGDAVSPEREVAVTQLEVHAHETKQVILLERIELRKGPADTDPMRQARVIGWSE